MRETIRVRPTLICRRVGGVDVVDVDEEDVSGGEVLGGKGIQINLLHRRLGHTSKSVMERLVREGMVRG